MRSTSLIILLLCLLLCLVIDDATSSNSYYHGRGRLPWTFRRGDRYPDRDDDVECRPIKLHIARGSKRFRDLVVNTENKYLRFANADCRIMSSRLHSRLSVLAKSFWRWYRTKLYIVKAWVPYPDRTLDRNNSLHYEGRCVRIRVTGFYSSRITQLLRMAISNADFDWVYYDKNGYYVRLCVIPDVCDANLDVVFVLDQSGSVGKKNHKIALNFLRDVVDYFKISATETQVSLVTYSTHARVYFDLNDLDSKKDIQRRISSVRYAGGWTATALGLFQAGVILNPQQQRGARPLSAGIPRVTILLTDGRSNRLSVYNVSRALHSAGVQVYTVGIGHIYLPELKFIASDPDQYHVFLLDSFADAEKFVDFLSITTCDTPAVVEPGENTTTEVPEDGFRFFQTECAVFSLSVVVEQIDLYGRCNLYASTVKPNPGPLDNSSIVVRNESISNSHRRTVILRGVKKFIYISIRGIKTKNLFTVIIWDMLFNQEYYKRTAPEGVANQLIFNLTAEVSVTTERYFFRIKEGNDNDDFRIGNLTGLLYTRNPLSIARQRYYTLLIVAENRNASCHRGKVTVKIRVVPNQLEFENIAPVSILENATGDVTQVEASGSPGPIQYSIINGNTGNAFRIDESTGVIAVANALDFESTPQYSLGVQARSSVGAIATATQIINVLDVNEPPVFTNSCAISNDCLFSVFENLTLSSLIGRIAADDPDRSSIPNGQLTYSLSPSNAPFTIDNTGRITLIALLDRETRDMYEVTIIVADNGSPRFSIMTNVTIRVLDSNDNAPVFSEGRSFLSIPENRPIGYPIEQFSVGDRDIGINAIITFSLTSDMFNLPFSIENNGLLFVSGPLDADRGITLYQLTVVASNFDGLSTGFNVSIEITDVNDNAPQFLDAPIRANVTEHSPEGTFVVRVMADDIDSGANGEVTYSITGGNANDAFSINNVTGAITVNADIDRETTRMFDLTVRAEDRGQPSMRNTTEVRVVVLDINDNAPIFTPNVFSLTIPENQQLGSLGTTVTATDNDEPGNPNSIIMYIIVAGNTGNHFSIDSSTGLLSLASSLDFEEQDSFTLTVQGQDGGNPVMSGTAVVNIIVTNVNEHAPVITGDVTIALREDEPVGSLLAQFNATDLDQMTVHFSIIASSNPDGIFSINTVTGVVSLAASLDFETRRQHTVIIQANDTLLVDTATLTVNVLDVNEFPPQFTGETEFSVDEERSPGTVVGTVEATDRDGNDTVMYLFERSTVSPLFSINSTTGEITTAMTLDREGLVEDGYFEPPQSEEMLVVIAIDSGTRPGPLRTVQNITIRLNDINDNRPVFDPNGYEASIPENTNGTTSLFTLSATDADLGSNAVIRFSLSVSNNFEVDPVSGIVSATQPFDREDENIFGFFVIATDQGNPALSASTTATVRVTDVNDNAPQFNNFNDMLSVPENTPVGRILDQVAVADRDQGSNAMITITSREGSIDCLSTPSACFFRVDNSGIIRLNRPLDFETQNVHNVTLIATDSGMPMLSTSQILTVNVVNVDERAPEFLGSCDSSIPENAPVGSLATACPARDFDEVAGEFTDRISYSITEGNEDQTFSINSDGNITTNVQLDRETTPSYTLRIAATDSGRLTTTMQVIITVTDANDNTPQLTGPYFVSIEDADITSYQSFVVNVSATDADIGDNGAVQYAIAETNINVDEQVTVLQVTATDRGTPVALSNSTFVNITFESACILQNYIIDSITGVITGQFLCRISIAPATNQVILGTDFSLSCNVFRNTDVSVQFIHNSSFIDSPTVLTRGTNQAVFTRDNVSFSDAGQYHCRATNSFSSLQTSPGSTVEIQVPARIIEGPADATVDSGTAFLSFVCRAEGVPTPTISWRNNNDETVVSGSGGARLSGNQLILVDVDETFEGEYTCVAQNEAGSDSSSARLSVITPTLSVVVAEVVALSDPDPIQGCNSFDARMFEQTVSEITNHQAMVTNSVGSSLCESDACHPNPCVNGTCNVTSDGDYQCTCTPGFSGQNCDVDDNECENDICMNGGTCEDISGGFICHCTGTYYGDFCEYDHGTCKCPHGAECLQTDGGSQCILSSTGSHLVIEEPVVNNVASLDNTVNTLLEDPPSSSDSRRKRDGFVTVCTGQFVQLSGSTSTYSLIWVCPDEAEAPNDDQLRAICERLVELQLVKVCHPPQGSPVRIAEVPPSRINISMVLMDSNGRIMSGEDVLQVLQDTNAMNKMRESGFTVVKFRRVSAPSTQSVSSENVGGAIGGVFVAVVLIVLVTLIVVVVVLRARYNRKNRGIRIPVMELDEKNVTFSNSSTSVEEDRYSRVPALQLSSESAITSDIRGPTSPRSPVNPYSLFDDPIYTKVAVGKKSTLERAKKHHLEKSSSLEKLLDHDDDEDTKSTKSLEEGDEPIYGNMNFAWKGGAGERWENYWKTATVTRGATPPN